MRLGGSSCSGAYEPGWSLVLVGNMEETSKASPALSAVGRRQRRGSVSLSSGRWCRFSLLPFYSYWVTFNFMRFNHTQAPITNSLKVWLVDGQWDWSPACSQTSSRSPLGIWAASAFRSSSSLCILSHLICSATGLALTSINTTSYAALLLKNLPKVSFSDFSLIFGVIYRY